MISRTQISCAAAAILVSALIGFPHAQQPVPQPFPRPAEPARQPPPQEPASPQTQPAVPPAPTAPGEPTEATLGLPIYPGAQFIASYDAGRGQRYYLFGTIAGFAEVVTYYRDALRQRGVLVFDQPATHMFETARFREETMAFPPGVTVKDYTWGGGQGYLNPKPGGQPERFRTVVQIVPEPVRSVR